MTRSTAKTPLLIPALGPIYDAIGVISLPFIRAVCGIMLIPFGWAKLSDAARFANEVALFSKLGIEPAAPFAWFICSFEFFGGIALALGLLTRPLALALSIEMMVITFVVMIPEGRPYQFTLMWGLIAFAIFWRGGGRCSVDRWIGREF